MIYCTRMRLELNLTEWSSIDPRRHSALSALFSLRHIAPRIAGNALVARRAGCRSRVILVFTIFGKRAEATAPEPSFGKISQEKQEKVFQAAVTEFASNGYRNASMNNLVKNAGISKGSLFQYFRTKRDLFGLVVETATGKAKDYLKSVRRDTEDAPFFDRIEEVLRSGFRFIDEHPLLARIYFHSLQSGEAPFGAERIVALRRKGNDFLAEMIRQAIARQETRADLDPDRMAFLLNSMFETLLRSYYTEFLGSGLGLYKGKTEDLDAWVNTTMSFIRHGLGANA